MSLADKEFKTSNLSIITLNKINNSLISFNSQPVCEFPDVSCDLLRIGSPASECKQGFAVVVAAFLLGLSFQISFPFLSFPSWKHFKIMSSKWKAISHVQCQRPLRRRMVPWPGEPQRPVVPGSKGLNITMSSWPWAAWNGAGLAWLLATHGAWPADLAVPSTALPELWQATHGMSDPALNHQPGSCAQQLELSPPSSPDDSSQVSHHRPGDC